jgi:antitoxin component YwqK of YwqJK toxin-antitoxin module
MILNKMNIYLNKTILLISIIILTFSCTDNEYSYHKNGKLWYTVPTKNGKRNGKLKQYYDNGDIQLISHWKNGIKIGKAESYYHNGNIENTEFFRDGLLIDSLMRYDSLGNIFSKIHFKDGKRHGPYFEYFSNGKIKVALNYFMGSLEGKGIMYYEHGNVFAKLVFRNDSILYSIDYDENGKRTANRLPVYYKILPENDSDSLKLEIGMEFSYFDSTGVRVILGNLDSDYNKILDTLATKYSKDSLFVIFNLHKKSIKNNLISGKLYEFPFKNKEEKIKNISVVPFTFNLKK